jgi:hypothetical protein
MAKKLPSPAIAPDMMNLSEQQLLLLCQQVSALYQVWPITTLLAFSAVIITNMAEVSKEGTILMLQAEIENLQSDETPQEKMAEAVQMLLHAFAAKNVETAGNA